MTDTVKKEEIIAELNREFDLMLQSDKLSEAERATILRQLLTMTVIEKAGSDTKSEES